MDKSGFGACMIDRTFRMTKGINEWLINHYEFKRKAMILTSYMLDFL